MLRSGLAGYPELAADHILHEEMQGKLEKTVGNLIRRLNLKFRDDSPTEGDSEEELKEKIVLRSNAYQTLIQTAMNLVGREKDRAGFDDEKTEKVLDEIKGILADWEELEEEEVSEIEELDSTAAEGTVNVLIEEMKRIQGGVGMIAKLGEEANDELEKGRTAASFVSAMEDIIQDNVYYKWDKKGCANSETTTQ
ncbi:hypothetical protein AKJ57_01015 [candidate division MSBL1 archaeon SCGC-AAA259A05]|uniref:Uncharacterized protein n=1 Tax=candidate division MSBL1 archaeon SCGC-AAA259A05 TaxID=1698259 RepID=A0A133UBC9_9EURY|nr:hypothetical protein AKJ57_01015 [candidate division MSBL1 archaeon SCGC-AAA259A05]